MIKIVAFVFICFYYSEANKQDSLSDCSCPLAQGKYHPEHLLKNKSLVLWKNSEDDHVFALDDSYVIEVSDFKIRFKSEKGTFSYYNLNSELKVNDSVKKGEIVGEINDQFDNISIVFSEDCFGYYYSKIRENCLTW